MRTILELIRSIFGSQTTLPKLPKLPKGKGRPKVPDEVQEAIRRLPDYISTSAAAKTFKLSKPTILKYRYPSTQSTERRW